MKKEKIQFKTKEELIQSLCSRVVRGFTDYHETIISQTDLILKGKKTDDPIGRLIKEDVLSWKEEVLDGNNQVK